MKKQGSNMSLYRISQIYQIVLQSVWRLFKTMPDVGRFPAGTKEPTCQCRRHKKCRFDPWVKKIPWRKAWHPTPLFLPGESHRQRRSAAVHGVAQSRTRSKQLSTHAHKQLRTNDVVRERGAHRRGSGGGQRNLD